MSTDADVTGRPWTLPPPDASDIAEFVPGPGIVRLDAPAFDLDELRAALAEVLTRIDYDDSYGEWGFGVLPVTRRPGTEGRDPVDLSGRFWIRPDDSYNMRHITAPVFNADGNVALALSVLYFEEAMTASQIESEANRVMKAAHAITETIHGIRPNAVQSEESAARIGDI